MKSVLALFFVLSIVSCASVERGTRTELVGHWRYMDKKQSCDYSFKRDGSFTGEVRQHARLVSKFTGRWTVRHQVLLYTYISDAFGRIPSGATDRDQLLEVNEDSFLIQAANGDRRRYRRVR
ncbi:MAG: hypothetical protein DME70_02675 [Verrucomicrobia bacterium]|nr:MAG: hypothetical protein DME70_02675 [Verrucomicrobiota bacterium]